MAKFVLISITCASAVFVGSMAFAESETSSKAKNPRTGVVCMRSNGVLDIHSQKKGCNTKAGEFRASGGTITDFVAANVTSLKGEPGSQGPVGPEGPRGQEGPVGPPGSNIFPRMETFVFGVADAMGVVTDDSTLQGKRMCFVAGTQQINSGQNISGTNSNFVGVVVPTASGITASDFSAESGFSMGVSPAVNVWAVNETTLNQDGSRGWRVIYGCVVPPGSGTSQVPVNVSASGRCAGRLVVTCITD